MFVINLRALWLLFVFLLAGVLFAAKLAREQGGREVLWALVATAAALLGYFVAAPVVAIAFASSEHLGVIAFFAGPLVSVGAQALAIFILYEYVQRDPKLKTSIPAFCLSRGDEPGHDCRIRLLDGQLLLEGERGARDLSFGWEELQDTSVDGECLRLELPGGPLLLQPGDPELAPAARRRLCRSLSAAIEQRRHGRQPGVSPTR